MTTIEAEPKSVPVPQDRRAELRIKVKSLALEAVAIRQDERRHRAKAKHSPDEAHKGYHRMTANGLRYHRIGDVRKEARHSQLAYAFLLGRPYRKCEVKVCDGNEVDAAHLSSLAHRFSSSPWGKVGPAHEAAVKAWLTTNATTGMLPCTPD